MRDIHGNYWNALRNQVGITESAICELFDNSVDAFATKVDITFKGGNKTGRFAIRDNGTGVEDIEKMFVMGLSDNKGGDSSGRYGLGSKPSMAYFGKVIEVTSVCNGMKRRMRWDTDKDLASGEWKKGMKVFDGVRTTEPSGTLIEVTFPHTKRIASSSMADRLSQHLSPALEKGVEVSYNGEPLSRFEFTWDGDPVVKNGSIMGDRYEITAGRAKGIPQTSCGLHVEKCHRSLPDYLNSRDGLSGDLSILVRVRLLQTDHGKNEWPLDPTSKASLSDSSQWAQLRTAIKECVIPEVEKKQDEVKNLMLEGIRSKFEDVLNGRSRRSKNGDHSIVDGTGSLVEADPRSRKGNGGGRTAPVREGGAGMGDTHESSRSSRSGITVEFLESNPNRLPYDWDQKGDTVVITLFNDQYNNSPSEAPRVAAMHLSHALWFASCCLEDKSLLAFVPDYHETDPPNVWVGRASRLLKGMM